jgi:hypothetical protein
MKTPCELIVWHILPGIRREFAKILVEDFKLTQRETAKKLGLTESAISQYLKSKRGQKLKLNKKINNEIKKSMKELSISKSNFKIIEELCSICTLMRNYGLICDLHKEKNAELNNCKFCTEKKK